MAEKRSFKQAMGQEKFNRKKVIQIMVAAAAGVFLLVLVFMALGGGEEEVAAPEPVSTPMVPTSLRYYDPLSEETYETGVNYVILNQSDGSRIRVSDDGRVVEIDERGNVLREISDGSEYISTVRGLMATDSQLAMAMDGLAIEEDVAPEMSPYDEFYQSFLEYAESQGVDLDTLLSGLYAEGYGPERLFELQDAGLPWRGVVDEVVAGIRETESQDGEDGQTVGMAIPEQEEFDGGFMLDLSIGKYIRLAKGRSMSVNLTLNNVTNNTNMKTGGYEQNRDDAYDDGRERPYQFSRHSKYYYAQGLNGFLNVNFRF